MTLEINAMIESKLNKLQKEYDALNAKHEILLELEEESKGTDYYFKIISKRQAIRELAQDKRDELRACRFEFLDKMEQEIKNLNQDIKKAS